MDAAKSSYTTRTKAFLVEVVLSFSSSQREAIERNAGSSTYTHPQRSTYRQPLMHVMTQALQNGRQRTPSTTSYRQKKTRNCPPPLGKNSGIRCSRRRRSALEGKEYPLSISEPFNLRSPCHGSPRSSLRWRC